MDSRLIGTCDSSNPSNLRIEEFSWGELDDRAIDSLDPNLSYLGEYSIIRKAMHPTTYSAESSSSSSIIKTSNEMESLSSEEIDYNWQTAPLLLLDNVNDFEMSMRNRTILPPISQALGKVNEEHYNHNVHILDAEHELNVLISSPIDPVAKVEFPTTTTSIIF